MLLRIYSDLHLEFGVDPPDIPAMEKDEIVVLAGDISTGTTGIQWAQRHFSDRQVIYVVGNHEYYGRQFAELLGSARKAARGSNVALLENASLDVGGYRFLGCTLWTDFMIHGEDRQEDCARLASRQMGDYMLIRSRRRSLDPKETIAACQCSKEWLNQEISASDKPLIVVTHHAPTLATVNPRYRASPIAAAFHNAFDDLFRRPVHLWIHGHTHYNIACVVNGIPVISNQGGYPHERLRGFDWMRSVRV